LINVTQIDLPELDIYVVFLKKIWSSKWVTNNGEFLQSLEAKLAEYLRVKNLLAVANGTVALQIAFKALGLQGEVITTPFTFAATTNVILWEGLTPVFADIDPETFNIDLHDVEQKITDRTSAILAVHVYGNPCSVRELQRIADRYKLKLIYDGAHAFAVEYDQQPVLNFGEASTLSFHATKIFSTIEGGAIVFRDEDAFEKAKLMRNHGIRSEEEVVLPGLNAKMNEIQAAMGICALATIDDKISKRGELYRRYKEQLKGIPDITFQTITASKYNYAYMPVCFVSRQQRDAVYSELVNNGIKPRKYFYPLTANFDYFKEQNIDLVAKYILHTASDIAGRVLCLPLYTDLSAEDVNHITGLISQFIHT